MRAKLLTISIAYLIILSGCLTHTLTHTMPIDAPSRIVYNPPTGLVKTANVGDSLITSPLLVKSLPAFKAAQTYQPPKAGFTSFPTIYQDSEWKCPRILPSGLYACEPNIGFSAGRPMNGNTPTRGKYYLTVSKEGNLTGWIIGSMSGQWTGVPQGLLHKIDNIDDPIFTGRELRQELLYNGKSKDTIKISYREFSNNLARPAFTQDLTYDLSESNVISFRKAKIEVIEATNSYIRYKVLKQL